MHTIPPYETAVSLFHRDSDVWVYPTLKAALRELGFSWIQQNVGKEFREFSCAEQIQVRCGDQPRYIVTERHYAEHAFVMRDDFGKALTALDFQPLRPYRTKGYRRWRETWNGEGPVPHTGRWRRGGHYFRAVRFAPEMRLSIPVKEDGEPAPRPSRNFANLPDSWDDYPVRSRWNNNWKRYRRQQWKA